MDTMKQIVQDFLDAIRAGTSLDGFPPDVRQAVAGHLEQNTVVLNAVLKNTPDVDGHISRAVALVMARQIPGAGIDFGQPVLMYQILEQALLNYMPDWSDGMELPNHPGLEYGPVLWSAIKAGLTETLKPLLTAVRQVLNVPAAALDNDDEQAMETIRQAIDAYLT